MIPIPGASRPESIRDNIAASQLRLAGGEFRELHAAIVAANSVKGDE